MTVGKVVAILGLCAMLCLAIGIFVDNAHAQTVEKGDEVPNRATPVQMAIGIGSCFVAVIVVKWI